MNTESLCGAMNFVTFIDEFSRHLTVYPITQKSEVLDKFKEWEAVVTNQADYKIKTLRTENGREYMSAEFPNFLKEKEFIARQLYLIHHNRMVSPAE